MGWLGVKNTRQRQKKSPKSLDGGAKFIEIIDTANSEVENWRCFFTA